MAFWLDICAREYCFVLTSNSRSGSKLTFYAVLDNYFESSFTHYAAVYMVVYIHWGDPSPLVRVRVVAYFWYGNYLAFISFVKFRLDMPELIVE